MLTAFLYVFHILAIFGFADIVDGLCDMKKHMKHVSSKLAAYKTNFVSESAIDRVYIIQNWNYNEYDTS